LLCLCLLLLYMFQKHWPHFHIHILLLFMTFAPKFQLNQQICSFPLQLQARMIENEMMFHRKSDLQFCFQGDWYVFTHRKRIRIKCSQFHVFMQLIFCLLHIWVVSLFSDSALTWTSVYMSKNILFKKVLCTEMSLTQLCIFFRNKLFRTYEFTMWPVWSEKQLVFYKEKNEFITSCMDRCLFSFINVWK
jgi:hypothetical protein